MATNESILRGALTLFAEKGYDGTGVDLIAERAGIQGPTIYRHFNSKQEMLDLLVDDAESRYDEYFGVSSIPKNKKEFIKMTLDKIKFMMTDPMVRKIRIFLVRTQFRSERIAKVTDMYQMDGMANLFERIISEMMKEGLIKKDNPELLFWDLIAPAMFLITKVDALPECEKESLKIIDKHIRKFCDKYMV